MNESKDESKVTIKSSLLVGLIIFALILLLTVVFLFGFLIGSGKNKQTIVTEIDEFTIGHSSGNKENVTILTKREHENDSLKSKIQKSKKEDTQEDSNKNVGFVPFGSQQTNSSEDENKDTRNLSALFSSEEEQNNSSHSNSNYKSKSSNSSINYSSNNNVSSESGKEAVKNYFMELELKLAASKTWTDPNQFAEQLLRSAMTGDFSELNNLTENMERVSNEIENMKIPLECSEHRNSVIASLKDSIDILKKVEKGIDTGDMQIILSLTAEAEKLKSNAQKSDDLMKKLKSKYNI